MLRSLWQHHADNRRKELRTKDILFVTFAVDDATLARRLWEYHTGREEAQKAISKHIKALHAPALFGAWTTVRYTTDTDGIMNRMAYSGFVPEGWGAEPDSRDHWLVPMSPDAVQAVRALPPLYGPKHLGALIDWPVFDPRRQPREWQHYAERANFLPRVYGRDGRAFVDLPHPDNFTIYPPIADAVRAWPMPAGMRPVGQHRNARDKLALL